MSNIELTRTDYAAWIGAYTSIVLLFYTLGKEVWSWWHQPEPKIVVEYLQHDDPPEIVFNKSVSEGSGYFSHSPELVLLVTNTGTGPAIIHDVRLRFPIPEPTSYAGGVPVFMFSQQTGDSPTLLPGEGHYYSCPVSSEFVAVINGSGAPYLSDKAIMELQVRSATSVLWSEKGPRDGFVHGSLISRMYFDIGLCSIDLRNRANEPVAPIWTINGQSVSESDYEQAMRNMK